MSDFLNDRLAALRTKPAPPLAPTELVRRRGEQRRRRTRLTSVAVAVALVLGGAGLAVAVSGRGGTVTLQPAGPTATATPATETPTPPVLNGLTTTLLRSEDAERASGTTPWIAAEPAEAAFSLLQVCPTVDIGGVSGVRRDLTRGGITVVSQVLDLGGDGAPAALASLRSDVARCPSRGADTGGTTSFENLPSLDRTSVAVKESTEGESILWVEVASGSLLSVIKLPWSEQQRARQWADVARARTACAPACAQPNSTPDSSTPSTTAAPDVLDPGDVLRPDGIGPITIGMTEAEARAAAGQPLSRFNDELGNGCGYMAVLSHRPDVTFMLVGGLVARVEGVAGTVTAEGLGFGATEDDVRAAYSGVTSTQNEYDMKGHYLRVAFGDNALLFETDGVKVTALRGGRSGPVDYVEGCA